jgi:hypothetical protein
MAFPQMVAGYDGKLDPREKILTPEEMQVFVDAFKVSGFTGGVNWYRNMPRNWERSAHIDHTVRVPSLMIMARMMRCFRRLPATGWRVLFRILKNT